MSQSPACVAAGLHFPTSLIFAGTTAYVVESGLPFDGAPPGGRMWRLHGADKDFAVNRYVGPASKAPHGGFERPSHCAFGPDGSLYVVDFGEVVIAPEVGGVRIRIGSGSLWRIRRTADPVGAEPAKPHRLPLYALRVAGAGLATAAATWLTRRLWKRR